MKRILAVMSILATILFGAPALAALSFTDSFDGGAVDPFWWTVAASGGSTVAIAGNRVEMTQGETGSASMGFRYTLSGDFTATVDYSLVNWPANNGERSGFGSTLGAVERISDSGFGGEVYLTHFADGVQGNTATTDLAGTLKFSRSGSTLSGYFRAGSDWTLIHSITDARDISLGMSIWPGFWTTPGVRVAFDNFSLYAPDTPSPVKPVPEPGAVSLLASGLAGLALYTKRKRG